MPTRDCGGFLRFRRVRRRSDVPPSPVPAGKPRLCARARARGRFRDRRSVGAADGRQPSGAMSGGLVRDELSPENSIECDVDYDPKGNRKR